MGGALAGSGSASTVVLSHVAGHQLQISAGALLMLANSAAVIGVGVLIFPVLNRHHQNTAYGYLTAQVVQGVMLAVGIVFLLLRIPIAQQYAGAGDTSTLPALARAAQEGNHYAFWIGMLSVGIGGLPGRRRFGSGRAGAGVLMPLLGGVRYGRVAAGR